MGRPLTTGKDKLPEGFGLTHPYKTIIYRYVLLLWIIGCSSNTPKVRFPVNIDNNKILSGVMKIRSTYYLAVLMAIVSTLFLQAQDDVANDKPLNIALILADDLGWSNLGCYGSNFIETPNIDKLVTKGIRFTDAYSAATVCAPTRASIITGQNPARIGIYNICRPHRRPWAKIAEEHGLDCTPHISGGGLPLPCFFVCAAGQINVSSYGYG